MIDGVLMTHPLAKDNLIRSILRFYCDVEQTGMSSQFYDKFNIRYNISQILKCVWKDSNHARQIVLQSRDSDFFIQFVNLLMNDTTYLLDEALSKLKEIGPLQVELERPLESLSKEEQLQRPEREKLMSNIERQATSCMSLGNETVHMLRVLTGNPEIVNPFMANEVIERLAAMLDYNLVKLAGPSCIELKVKAPEKYRFDPKVLLNDLLVIFINLSHRSEFVQAVARDERSFNEAVFSRAASILMRNHLFTTVILKIYDRIKIIL